MSQANESGEEAMSKVDLLVALNLILDQFESHPDNKGTVSLRFAFADDGRSEYRWDGGKFVVSEPDLPGEDN